MNNLKTTILMVGLIFLFVFIGQLVGGRSGMVYAFLMAVFMNGIAFWFSDKIILAMYGAKPLKEQENPKIYSIVKQLVSMMQIPMPKLYVINNPSPNAFATGRNPSHAAVVLTTGIINLLTERELQGVIAHELSHIKNRDTLISVVAATIAGAIFTLARIAQWSLYFGDRRNNRNSNPLNAIALIVLIVVAPLTAMIIQLAISRSREFEADKTAGKSIGDPLALADALRKLEHSIKNLTMNASPTTAHMFIVNPLKADAIMKLFSTHPPIKDRVKKLEELNSELKGYKIPNVIR